MARLERRSGDGVGLPLHVDEPEALVGEPRLERRRVDAERAAGGERGGVRVEDLLRIGVDGGRLLADRERRAEAVVDRPAARRERNRLAVLRAREPRQRRGADALDPDGAEEDGAERERERGEEEPDPAVDEGARPHRPVRPSSTYVVSVAGMKPRARARLWMRLDAAAVDTCASRSAFSARRFARSRPARSSWTFSRSTTTFSATTPVSSTALTTIHARPPAMRRLDDARPRGRGRGRAGGRAGASSERARSSEATQSTFLAVRSRADEARGFAASSAGVGRIAFRWSARRLGSWPQTQTGKSGGQTQPRSSRRRNRFTIRSSSEWKLITARRPPGRRSSSAAGSARSSAPSSSFTAMRGAWKTRFAGCPSPKRAGAGIAARIASTSSPVRSIGARRRRRPISRAIWRA